LRILVNNKLRYTISTNASKFIGIDSGLLKNLYRFDISMPGFSQSSYNKIHGFNFEEVLRNIDQWILLIGPGKIQINFHVYQFNLDEIEGASDYFKQKGVKFFPYLAFIADYNVARAYLNHTLPQNLLEEASKELLLFYTDDLLSSAPGDYACPQLHILTIDEYCNVLTCCLISKADPNYSIGSLFTLSGTEIEQKKKDQNICGECMTNGISYWVHNISRPAFIQKYG
jgi:hypothetical protein